MLKVKGQNQGGKTINKNRLGIAQEIIILCKKQQDNRVNVTGSTDHIRKANGKADQIQDRV